MMQSKDDFLDASGAAAFLGLNDQTVRRLSRDRLIPAFKVGGVWRYQREHLQQWARDRADKRERHNQTILVIDDEVDFATIIRGMLSPAGYQVISAPDGPSGLKLLDTEKPDLVFLDLVMPGMLGPEVLREIRTRTPDMPVAILTAYPDSKLMQEALLYSPITLLSKPFSREQLTRTVQQTLDGSLQANRYAIAS